MNEWELEDVETVSKLNPSSFFIPDEKERKSQKKGDLVRLHFILTKAKENEPRAERMWVEITNRGLFGNKYIGVLTNQPVYLKTIKIGDQIKFEPKNIAQTIIKKNDPRWIDSSEKKALVSNMCMEDGAVIRWLYREKPDRKEDSGWRMFTGLESDEYSNNPQNIRIISVGYLLDKDPTLLEALKGDYGSAYERKDKVDVWIKVDDWCSPED